MATSFKYLKLSKVVLPSMKPSHFNHKRSLFHDSSLMLNRSFVRSIVASPKDQQFPRIKDDLSQTFITFKYLRLIKRAVREGGPITEKNKRLATLLSKARQNKLPADFIEFALKISIDYRSQVGLLEMLLDNHCHLIIQYEDIDLSYVKPHLLKLCDRCDGYLMRKDAKWHLRFEQVGMLLVKDDPDSTSFKDAKEAKLIVPKIGAKSVEHKIDAEGCPYWQFYCDPSELHEVKKQLTDRGEIEEAYVGYIPKHNISLPNSSRKTLYTVINELSKIPRIDNVFLNCM